MKLFMNGPLGLNSDLAQELFQLRKVQTIKRMRMRLKDEISNLQVLGETASVVENDDEKQL